MRTKSTLLNVFASYIGQICSVIIVLITRFFFIKVLSEEYLGLNGLFSNILMILSLVELGVGPAIIYALYKPISTNDKEQIKSLLSLYKKVYTIIGIVILILGLLISPFLSFFINEMPNIPNIKLIFILFVISSSVSYFFSYKRSLIASGSFRYILPIYKYSIVIISNIIQIIVLLITKNYILFLITQIVFTIIENILVSLKADKMYPYIKEKDIKPLDSKVKNRIVKNTKAMIFHKVGSVLVRSTDNIIISKMISLIAVGFYSNYFLVISALDNVSNQFFNSITASAGNLYATESNEKTYNVFRKLFFINFIIYMVFASGLLCILNPFIELWLGKDLLFSNSIVIVLIINVYLNGMRKSTLIFRDAMGLYYEDRYKPILESLINIVSSIILAKYFGIIGVFIGTTLCIILTSFWIEPYVLYKYGLKQNPINYFKKYFIYTLITIIVCFISSYICSFITGNNILILVLKLIISIFLPLISVIILFRNKEEYVYLKNQIFSIKKIVSR